MTPFKRLRTQVLKVTQAEIASVTDTTQATVSRWEKGELFPDASQLGKLKSKYGRKVNLNTLANAAFLEKSKPDIRKTPSGDA
jgi:transcriptional regulator with XRE-family HTH domain